jgi:thiol-disulfide isomerase/thioredoxin
MAFIGWADGKPFRTSELKGKVVVVETWASWCHFCKEAFPFYEKTRQALADQDVVFVAVSFDSKLAEYEKWMKQHGADYGFKFGRVDSPDPTKAMWEFRGSLPAFYVLGRDGKVISSYLGYGYGSGNEDPRLLAALRTAGIKI